MSKGPFAVIAGRSFSKRKELEEYVRGLLNGAPLNERLAEQDFMSAFLQRHPCADHVTGIGLSHFEVRTNISNGYKSRGFHAVRTDGSSCAFSIKVCFDQRTHSEREMLFWALREAVKQSVQEYRAQAFDIFGGVVPCEITGKHLRNTDKVHVDHAPPWPFVKIADEFIQSEKLTAADVHNAGIGNITLAKADQAARFKSFHDNVARLRIVDGEANMKAQAHARA